MSEPKPRSGSASQKSTSKASELGWLRAASAIWLVLGLATGLVMIGEGIYQLVYRGASALCVALTGGGVMLAAAGVAGFAVLQAVRRFVRAAEAAEWNRRRISMVLDEIRDDTRTVAGNSHLSDAAKSLAHREAERRTLRRALHECIDRMDWEAAYGLADELERRFGYKEEAERLREEIHQSRENTIEAKIEQAIDHVRHLFAEHDWARARRESVRLQRLFSDDERVKRLSEELREHQERYKNQLLTEWHEAASRNEIDRSIEILKEVDEFLTPREAAALRDEVKEVFQNKLNLLTTQLALAVHDQQWLRAVEVAQQIVAEFPNTQRAAECRQRMELLKTRAGLVAPELV